jgi:hypothetical protein
VGQLFDLDNLIASTIMDKSIAIILHTMQATQALNLPKVQPKSIFNIGCDHFGPSMAIIFSIHALHM